MEFDIVIKFIKSRYNIDLLNYKESRIHKRTISFMQRKKIPDYSSLISYLSKKQNFDDFMEFHRINISYFLRDPVLFDNLINHIKTNSEVNEALKLGGVLSIGCSKGEELYSLIFLLMHHKLEIPKRIIGIDSDQAQLIYAKKTRWHKNSVQDYDLFLKKYLIDDNTKDHYTTNNTIKNTIKFIHFDIMKNSLETLLPCYGLIMCRNTIIYFNEEFRDAFLKSTAKLIRKNGLLFLGSSEFIHDPGELGLKYIDHSLYRKII